MGPGGVKGGGIGGKVGSGGGQSMGNRGGATAAKGKASGSTGGSQSMGNRGGASAAKGNASGSAGGQSMGNRGGANASMGAGKGPGQAGRNGSNGGQSMGNRGGASASKGNATGGKGDRGLAHGSPAMANRGNVAAAMAGRKDRGLNSDGNADMGLGPPGYSGLLGIGEIAALGSLGIGTPSHHFGLGNRPAAVGPRVGNVPDGTAISNTPKGDRTVASKGDLGDVSGLVNPRGDRVTPASATPGRQFGIGDFARAIPAFASPREREQDDRQYSQTATRMTPNRLASTPANTRLSPATPETQSSSSRRSDPVPNDVFGIPRADVEDGIDSVFGQLRRAQSFFDGEKRRMDHQRSLSGRSDGRDHNWDWLVANRGGGNR